MDMALPIADTGGRQGWVPSFVERCIARGAARPEKGDQGRRNECRQEKRVTGDRVLGSLQVIGLCTPCRAAGWMGKYWGGG